jgi:hypothetical protein
MTEEFGQPLTIFATIVLGTILAGLTNARLSLKHPKIKAMLGEPVYLGPSLSSYLRHASNWFSFLVVGHFRERDVLLSALCVLQLAVGAFLVGALLGAWPLNFSRVFPGAG